VIIYVPKERYSIFIGVDPVRWPLKMFTAAPEGVEFIRTPEPGAREAPAGRTIRVMKNVTTRAISRTSR